MPELHVCLLGRFSMRCSDEHLVDLGTGKLQELLSYLLLHRHQPTVRETLASLLWENTTTESSKAYLRSALWKLQSTLHEHLRDVEDEILIANAGWVHWNPAFAVWLDVEVLERAYHVTEGVPGRCLDPQQVHMLEQAIALYSGDLLESYYQRWCLNRRERCRYHHLVLLDKTAAYYEARREYEKAMAFAESVLGFDRAREYTHRQLVRLKYLGGDRTGALRQYERCRAALREELDIAPSEQTQRLFESVRAGRAIGTQPVTVRAGGEANDVLEELLRGLAELKETQKRVCERLTALERSLRS